jgi:hypothetical protein
VKQSDEIQNIRTYARTLTGCDRNTVVHEMKSYSLPQNEAIDLMLQDSAVSDDQRIHLRKQHMTQKELRQILNTFKEETTQMEWLVKERGQMEQHMALL